MNIKHLDSKKRNIQDLKAGDVFSHFNPYGVETINMYISPGLCFDIVSNNMWKIPWNECVFLVNATITVEE